MSALNDSDLFESPAQSDLFGESAAVSKAYVPDQRHVRNRLEDLVTQMKAAQTWPWEPVIVRLHREKTFAYLCGLIADRTEAANWQARIASEVARLDAAAG